MFKVWNSENTSHLSAAFTGITEEASSDDSGGTDSDGSTSPSYSSLSEFVTDMCNSEISGDITGMRLSRIGFSWRFSFLIMHLLLGLAKEKLCYKNIFGFASLVEIFDKTNRFSFAMEMLDMRTQSERNI